MRHAHTNVESVASHVVNECRLLDVAFGFHSPIVLDGLNDKAKCWTDRVHVFVHQSLDDCGFTGVIQTSKVASAKVG